MTPIAMATRTRIISLQGMTQKYQGGGQSLAGGTVGGFQGRRCNGQKGSGGQGC